MQFLTVLIVVAALAFALALGFRLYAEVSIPRGARADWALDATAIVITLVMLLLLAGRSVGFGVDTVAYLELFKSHCSGVMPANSELSYALSINILDSATAGVCRADLVPLAWGTVFVLIILLAPARLAFKFRYSALLLLSMVGVELTTNALRQGLSVAVLVVGVATWEKSRGLAVGLFIAAAMLHESALLVSASFVLASLGWVIFFVGILFAGAGVLYILLSGNILAVLAPFLYEITKYMAHESDEIYVRILAFASLFTVVAFPAFFGRARHNSGGICSTSEFAIALRLAVTTLPFLALPYFGYRYVYGIMPVALWLTMAAAAKAGVSSWRLVLSIGLANLCILLVWSGGSSYMRQVPFFDL